MSQRKFQISQVSVDVNLMIGNVTRGKNGTIITVSVTVKNQQHIAHVKKIIPGILLHETGEYFKECEYMKNLVDDLVVTCNETVDTPESEATSPSN